MTYRSTKISTRNLLLIAREIMRLLIYHQLIPFPERPKRMSLERTSYCCTFAVLSPFFDVQKKDLKLISKSATNVVSALKFLLT